MKTLACVPPPNLDAISCYRAVQARDSRFDGVFFTAVLSTGIYCRPVCSAKTPAASSCQFYGSAAAAEAAGFRPCLRCRPELAPYALQQNLAYAVWQKICAGALNHLSLEQLAQEVGLSARQLRRVLQAYFGVSPIELAQTQRLLLAKQLLTETRLSMTEIAFAAGFGSVRRFNALFAARYQLTPSDLRHTPQITDEEGSFSLRLAYRPPLDWHGLLRYLAPRCLQGIEAVCLQNAVYQRSVILHGCEGWLEVRQSAQADSLDLRLASSLLPVLQAVLARVRELFDLDANPARIRTDLEQDVLLRNILPPGLRVPGGFVRFELAVRAILGQQVSVAAASTLGARLVSQFGKPAQHLPGNWRAQYQIQHHFPSPQELASQSLAALAALGLPQSRAATLHSFAVAATQGVLDNIAGAGLAEHLTRLQALPGIGPWSANYIALRCLRFPDAFPAGDLGLQKALAQLLPQTELKRISERHTAALAAGWSPWRGYAALALWQFLSHSQE